MKPFRFALVMSVAWLLKGGSAMAFLAGEPVELSWAIIINQSNGMIQHACAGTASQESRGQSTLAMHLLPITEDSGRRRKKASAPFAIVCSHAPDPDPNEQDAVALSWMFNFAGDVKYGATRQMEDERALTVVVSASVDFPPADNGATVQPVAAIDRKLTFSKDGFAQIPLWARGNHPGEIEGVEEIFLTLRVHEPLPEQDAIYGSIWVLSDAKDVGVLLDGGLAGRTNLQGELALDNVPVGAHFVSLEGDQQADSVQYVRVRAARRSPVDFRDAAPGQRNFTLKPLGLNAQGFHEYERAADGATVVEIPAAEFLMGNVQTERSPLEHQVYVSGFLMDRTGVTWGRYKRFAAQTGTPLPPHTPYWGIEDDFPVVYVTWEESKTYCEWVGGRLPTEAERELAARGLDGRMFPWGDEQPTAELGVFQQSWGYSGPAAVATHPAGVSPFGLHDMGGNVWEWCSDWYDGDYFQHSPFRDPRGPATGISHVVRGGSWDSRPSVLSASCRNWGHVGYRDGDFGFRCAMNRQN